LKKFFKILGWTLLTFVVLLFAAGSLFIYKVKNGFPVSYETEKPEISIPADKPAILLFSKTTGFRHEESIDASKLSLRELCHKNPSWFLYETEAGGIFNPEQLAQFEVVIFDNSTGRVLDDEQQTALEKYVENGGTLMGIHGAGDDSHHWDWYEKNLLGAKFSHHPLNPQFQHADVLMQENVDSTFSSNLAKTWKNTDEWYVFFSQPEAKILYAIDGEKILPSGNMLWMTDKDFGMGKSHPVAWYKAVGKGKTFYTSMGHSKDVWANPDYVKLIENAIVWATKP
jgi:type 1 glutamine amidotransferase